MGLRSAPLKHELLRAYIKLLVVPISLIGVLANLFDERLYDGEHYGTNPVYTAEKDGQLVLCGSSLPRERDVRDATSRPTSYLKVVTGHTIRRDSMTLRSIRLKCCSITYSPGRPSRLTLKEKWSLALRKVNTATPSASKGCKYLSLDLCSWPESPKEFYR